jgi:hypothetical protein
MAAIGNFETFEYELGYAWLEILGSRGTFLFSYLDAKIETIFGLPSKFCNF